MPSFGRSESVKGRYESLKRRYKSLRGRYGSLAKRSESSKGPFVTPQGGLLPGYSTNPFVIGWVGSGGAVSPNGRLGGPTFVEWVVCRLSATTDHWEKS